MRAPFIGPTGWGAFPAVLGGSLTVLANGINVTGNSAIVGTLTISSGGATINGLLTVSPTAGVGATFNAFTGNAAVQINQSGSTGGVILSAASTFNAIMYIAGNGNVVGSAFQIKHDSSNVATLMNQAGGGMFIGTNNTNRITIGAGGTVNIAAPDSTAVSLTVNAISGTHSTQIGDSANTKYNAGYLEVPQNIQNANYTCVKEDAGKHLYHSDGTAYTWTIPSNISVSYPVGTTLTFDNDGSAGNITIAINTDTLVWAPSNATGSRTLAIGGRATALKVASGRWKITGVGLT